MEVLALPMTVEHRCTPDLTFMQTPVILSIVLCRLFGLCEDQTSSPLFPIFGSLAREIGGDNVERDGVWRSQPKIRTSWMRVRASSLRCAAPMC